MYSKTWRGQYLNLFGYLLSFYCVYRLFMAIINILFVRRSQGSADPVTRWIGLAVHYVNSDFDVAFWSQQISFILVGSIIVGSVRNFLLQLMKVIKIYASFTTRHCLVCQSDFKCGSIKSYSIVFGTNYGHVL